MLPEHQDLYDAIKGLLEDQKKAIVERLDAQTDLVESMVVSQVEVVKTMTGLKAAVTVLVAVCPLARDDEPVCEVLVPSNGG